MSSNPKLQSLLTRPGGLADRLRKARAGAGLTGRELAARTGWPPSKISKIEKGQQLPDDIDLDQWAEHTGIDDDEKAEWTYLRAKAGTMRKDITARARAGHSAIQRGYTELIARSRHVRFYEISFVPAPLQTEEYARAVLTESAERHGSDPAEIDKSVAARLGAVPYLYDPDHAFEFVLLEQVLRLRPAALPVDVLRGQLDRLLRVLQLPNVRLGIIPLDKPISWWPQNSFQLFDDIGMYETWHDEHPLTLPDQVSKHDRVLAKMWEAAAEGDEARKIIERAREVLNH